MIFFLVVLFTVVVGQTCSCPSGSCLSTSVRYCFDATITVPTSVSASAVEVRIRAQSTDGSVFDLRVLSSSSYTCDGSFSNQYREFSATGVACTDTGKRVINARTFTVVFDNENSIYNAPINYLIEWTPIAPTTVASTTAAMTTSSTAAVASAASTTQAATTAIAVSSAHSANTTPATTGVLASTSVSVSEPATSAATDVCDGEITTCNECIAKSELGFACDWCSTSGSCHGEGDFFTPCSGTWKETCSAPIPTVFDCLACSGTCASGCNDGQLFGQPRLCSRGDVLVEGGKCRSSEDPGGCCVTSSPRPPSTATPASTSTKRTDIGGCTLNGSCDADNLCEALSAHLTCIVSSDLCNNYNQAFLNVVSQCPEAKTRCSCTTMEDPCRQSIVRCDKVQEKCDACRSCECNDRCCKEMCRDQQASFACSQTNGLISSKCSCASVATVINSTPTLAISSSMLLAVLCVPLR